MIRKGERIEFKPEYQDAGDSEIVFVALEDEFGGRVLVQAEIGLAINPTYVVCTGWLEEGKA